MAVTDWLTQNAAVLDTLMQTMTPRPVRAPHLREMKRRGEPIAVLTAYDAVMARLFERVGRGRHPRWRFGRHGRARLREHDSGHRRHDGAPHAGGGPRHVARAGHRRHAVPRGAGERSGGGRQRRAADAGGRRRRGEDRRRSSRCSIPCAASSTSAFRSWVISACSRSRSTRSADSGSRRPNAATRTGCWTTRERSEDAGAFAIVLESIPADVAAAATRTAVDSDDRHRCRAVVRRPGAGRPRHARALRSGAAVVRPPVRATGGDDRRAPPPTTFAMSRTVAFPNARFRPALLTTANDARPARGAHRRPPSDRLAPGESVGPVGFVPTMGALHAGHERLIQQARDECARVVVSIFVNPLQFDRADDLERYPRTLEADIDRCERLGVDLLFAAVGRRDVPDAAGVHGRSRSARHSPVRRVSTGTFPRRRDRRPQAAEHASAPTAPTSAKRTRSNWPSCGGWWPTSMCR